MDNVWRDQDSGSSQLFEGAITRALRCANRDGSCWLFVTGWLRSAEPPVVALRLGMPNAPFVLPRITAETLEEGNTPASEEIATIDFEASLPLDQRNELAHEVDINFLAALRDGSQLAGCFHSPVVDSRSGSRPTTLPSEERRRGGYVRTLPRLAEPSVVESHLRVRKLRLAAFLEADTTLEFPASSSPAVSVIMPLFNNAACTLGAIQALAEEARHLPLELVLVDNASSDETEALLGRIENVRILRNETNEHFVHACNAGAAVAQGTHLLFLNNDAEVQPGALQAALRAIREIPDAGAIGARIVRPDGRLQEAGGIVFRQGITVGYGTGSDPSDSQFRFRRPVDYCSAAFLLTPAQVFRDLGGFGPEFAPAYYEDVDYCFRLAERGLATWYEPDALVLHAESCSGPGDRDEQKARNQPVFAERHGNVLSKRRVRFERAEIESRSRAAGPRLLLVDDQLPRDEKGAGLPRARRLIEALVDLGLSVTLYPAFGCHESWNEIFETVPRTVEVIREGALTDLPEFLKNRPGFYDYLMVSRYHNWDRFQKLIQQVPPAALAGTVVIYDTEAISNNRELGPNYPEDLRADLRQSLLEREMRIASAAHRILAVSPQEAEQLRLHTGRPVEVVSHVVDARCTPARFDERRGLLFLGPLVLPTLPNALALEWFLNEVRPLLTESSPFPWRADQNVEMSLTHIGLPLSRFDPYVGPSFRMQGQVDEPGLFEHMNAARVFIAPMHYAAGIPLKVITAAAYGVPVVGTSLIARLLDWTPGEELLTGDTPQEFASAIKRLSTDPELWNRVRTRAFERVTREFDSERFRSNLSRIFPELQEGIGAPLPGSGPLVPVEGRVG